MNRNTLIIVGLVVVAVIVGGFIWSMKQKEEMMKPTDAMMKKDTMMKDDKQSLNYIDYSPAALASASQNGGKPVIFFKANWCPTCQAADAAFKANLDKIPAGVTVLKANYDTEKDLKAKYAITYQHTFVQVDGTGKELAKWNGGDVDNLTTHFK